MNTDTVTVTFSDAGVSNDTGIDITQGMIDNVANPFLDLDAIVTQFKFNGTSVTVKIPAGTTVRCGNDQCVLEEDVTATLTPNSSEDCHATTTSGTVLSSTTLDSGQLIKTSGQWLVELNSAVKVKTQDGYAILGTTDLDELSGGTQVCLTEGTNVYVANATGVRVEKVNEKAAQFYFLADVEYHQIVLQELYDTLEDLQNSKAKTSLLNYLTKECIGTGRNKLSEDEYNELINKSLSEIKKDLYSLNLFSEDSLNSLTTLDALIAFAKNNRHNLEPSDIIVIYESYGAFSYAEIQNLRAGKSLDGASTVSWTVDSLLNLVDNNAFTTSEINAIRKSADQKFLDKFKSVEGLASDDLKTAISGLYTVKGSTVNDICDALKNAVGSPSFTLDEFDFFLKNLANIKLSGEEICAEPPAWEEGTSCVQLSDAANKLFNELSSCDGAITADYLSTVFGSGTTLESLKKEVLCGTKTIQGIYYGINNKRSTDTKYQEKDDNGNFIEKWPPYGIASPNNAQSLNLTSAAEAYFSEIKEYASGTDPLLTLDNLKTVCRNLNVSEGNSVEECIVNLQNAMVNVKCKPSSINDQISKIITIDAWKSSTLQINQDGGIVRSIIENSSISLDELKKAVEKTGIYDNDSITNLRSLISNATSKTQVMEILSNDELNGHINVGDFVAGLTKVNKYSASLYKELLINEISATGKINGDTLLEYNKIFNATDDDGNITELASETILESLNDAKRIDYDGFKSGLLSISRFDDNTIYAAMTASSNNGDTSQEYLDSMNKLLNLCLLAGTPASGQVNYTLATGVQRTVDSNGNYVYTIVGSKTIQAGAVDASFTKQAATAGMALPYFALAIMYEKTCIQQMILVEQLKQIEKINDEIQLNNKALKALTELYDKVYTKVTWSAKYSDAWQYQNLSSSVSLVDGEMSVSKLDEYLKKTVQNAEGLGKSGTVSDFYGVNAESYRVNGDQFITVVARYDRDGNNMWERYTDDGRDKDGNLNEDFDSNTSNIDVKEQATLTHISNLQDQVRMYGDSLSTDAQLMTTKMEQYMQDANACVSACTQTVKSIGDYWKNIITNIR